MMKKTFLYSYLIIFLLTAAGCGQNVLEGMEDKESGSAKQYAALKSLDSGDFLSVLSACDAGTADPLDCSAAALGASGLDPLQIARQLNNLIDEANKGDVSKIGTLANLQTKYLKDIHSANQKLAVNCSATQDKNICSQLVVTSIAEVIMAIAQVGEKNGVIVDDADGIGTTGGSSSDANLIAGIISNDPAVKVDTTGDGTLDTPLVEVISQSASNIIDFISYSPFLGSGTGTVIQTQVNDIGGSSCGSGSTTCVSAPSLSAYMANTYGTSN